jgi:hypothetical protein
MRAAYEKFALRDVPIALVLQSCSQERDVRFHQTNTAPLCWNGIDATALEAWVLYVLRILSSRLSASAKHYACTLAFFAALWGLPLHERIRYNHQDPLTSAMNPRHEGLRDCPPCQQSGKAGRWTSLFPQSQVCQLDLAFPLAYGVWKRRWTFGLQQRLGHSPEESQAGTCRRSSQKTVKLKLGLAVVCIRKFHRILSGRRSRKKNNGIYALNMEHGCGRDTVFLIQVAKRST